MSVVFHCSSSDYPIFLDTTQDDAQMSAFTQGVHVYRLTLTDHIVSVKGCMNEIRFDSPVDYGCILENLQRERLRSPCTIIEITLRFYNGYKYRHEVSQFFRLLREEDAKGPLIILVLSRDKAFVRYIQLIHPDVCHVDSESSVCIREACAMLEACNRRLMSLSPTVVDILRVIQRKDRYQSA